ncbi:MAG: hypothetical protein WB662_20000 [Methyloceanibacter sp.]
MKHLTRRSVTTGAIAAVTILPAVGLSLSPTKTQPTQDKLLKVINHYKAEVAAINAVHDNLGDDEIDAWTDNADAILSEAAGLPALTAATALAALDLVVEEEDIGEHFKGLIDAVRGYIISTGRGV